MPSGKPRLYVALYPSGVSNKEESRYHWALLVRPKDESSKEVPGTPVANIRVTATLLARILVAKVEDPNRLTAILDRVPVVQDDAKWRCRSWIASALEAIAKDGKAVGTSDLYWTKIEEIGRRYVAEKTAAGRYNERGLLEGPRPTWDILQNKETVA